MTPRPVLAALALASCGCSPKVDPCQAPVPIRDCTRDGGSSTGCSFIATRQYHLVDALSDLVGVPHDAREPDAVVLGNPSADGSVVLDLYEVEDDRGCEVPLREEVMLGPGQIEVVELPSPTTALDRTHRRRGSMIRIDSDRPVSAFAFGPYRPFVGNDSAMLLPEAALGTRYVVASYPPHVEHVQGQGEPTYFDIIATGYGTTVRWRPRFGPTAGDGSEIPEVAAGTWSPTVELDRYEAIRVTAVLDPMLDATERDVSGTEVEASHPVSVFAGSRCSAVPSIADPIVGCDPLQEQMFPVSLWGTRYFLPHPPLRTNEFHYYRIFTATPDNMVRVEGSEVDQQTLPLLSAGDFVDVVVPHGASVSVDADAPVLAVGYLSTRNPNQQIGDPAMYQIVPTDRFDGRYVFATGIDWEVHLVQVVRPAGAGRVTLDETVIQGWEPAGDFEIAIVEIAEGAHVLDGEEPFGAAAFGWTNMVHDACTQFAAHGSCQTSYAHPLGLRPD